MTAEFALSRRQFIVASAVLGGGMAIGLNLGHTDAMESEGGSARIDPWLVIDADDTVTIQVTTPEIGNGASTQLAMTVAEELQCDWSKVRIEYASLDQDLANGRVYSKSVPIQAFFGGRSTVEVRNQVLLKVGASARERLRLAAAHEWGVPVSEITARNSVLAHASSGRQARYGAMAAKAAAVQLETEPTLKRPEEWTLLGKATPHRLHVPNIVNGTAQFGMDIRLPGMLYAALLQCPVQNGKLKRCDFEKIKHMDGVKGVAIIEPGPPLKFADELTSQPWVWGDPRTSAVAVVAEHYWQARTALAALPVEWEDGAGANWTSTEKIQDAALKLLGEEGKVIVDRGGRAESIVKERGRTLEAVYLSPYSDQAPLEPLNGTALVTAERVDLWHPSQITDNAWAAAIEESGLPPERVHVHQTLVGGGFGRRVHCDDVRMVVAVAAKFPGTPVHVIWSREETMRQGRYRPLIAVKLQAALDDRGLPEALVCRAAARRYEARPQCENLAWPPGVYETTLGLSDSAYAMGIVPHVRVSVQELPVHIRSGSYRGPGYNSTCFFIESFMDECAHLAGIDPLTYRLQLYEKWPDPGWILCLKEAAKQAGWGKRLPKGMAQGIAIGNFFMMGQPRVGTTVCTVATVEVTRKGEIKVHALDVAFDCGRYMNLDAVKAQMEGGTVFGLNMALNEGLSVKKGRIVEGNFDAYPMLRMADIPRINIHLGGLSGHERFAELGEAPAGTVGPAVANAVFRATGKRLRAMPFRNQKLESL